MKTHTKEPLVVRVSPILHADEQLINLTDQKVDTDVVLDVSDLGFATSMLLSELLELRKSIIDRGHRLIICCIDERVLGILSVTGLNNVFTIMGSEEEALAALREPDPTQSDE